jgi:catechol 2,3-dioxygenase-like lactoylglutathione lyase family enzyme
MAPAPGCPVDSAPVFDHVGLHASDQQASVAFYRAVLGALGIQADVDREGLVGWGEFLISPASDERPPTRHLHVGFVAPTREHVDAFWRAGVDAGHPDDGPPGQRTQYSSSYYGAFLRDPDGNSVEAVHHADTRRGGHIDHLWLGVGDVGAAEAFYTTIARHVGLRPGRRTDDLAQFRGAWATFSVVSDGRPRTEHLHIAFQAPDRETVREFYAAATAAGYESNGAPGERPRYHPGYYAAFVLDPDGTNVESVCHTAP